MMVFMLRRFNYPTSFFARADTPSWRYDVSGLMMPHRYYCCANQRIEKTSLEQFERYAQLSATDLPDTKSPPIR